MPLMLVRCGSDVPLAKENLLKTITKVDPISVMRIAGICYAALGLLEGIFFGLVIALKLSATPAASTGGRFIGPFAGLAAVVGFPILLGVFGALMAGVGALIYNVASKYVGGVVVTVE
jgi:hypothetical protein